jgi:DNA-binding XRE family transcriptional regulator
MKPPRKCMTYLGSPVLGIQPVVAPESFPERLLSVRKVLGLSQKAMARKLGVDPTTIGQCDSGKRRPSRRLLAALKDFIEQYG